jgi:hypothetical protein
VELPSQRILGGLASKLSTAPSTTPTSDKVVAYCSHHEEIVEASPP